MNCTKNGKPSADAILFSGRQCPLNVELKLLSDEGRTCVVACTLFALFVRLPCAGQKRNVCANAGLIEGLNCRVAGCLSVFANGRILTAKTRILSANTNFLFAKASFLKSVSRILSAKGKRLNADGKSLFAVRSFLNAKESFVVANGNSLSDLVKILNDRGRILFAPLFKLQFAYLFVLWTCCPEN